MGHSLSIFYKYTSAEAAISILNSSSLKYSSPLVFNDPFDNQLAFRVSGDAGLFQRLFMSHTERVIYGDIAPNVDPSTPIGKQLLEIRAKRDVYDRNQIISILKEIAQKGADHIGPTVDDLNEFLRTQAERARILCVSEANDNLLMWSHYADAHEGIVLGLRCIPEADNTLLAARSVRYARSLPEISLSQFTRHHLRIEPFDFDQLYWDLLLTKSNDWVYEREWRVILPESGTPGVQFDIWRENPNVFAEVYFGLRTPAQVRSEITSIVKNKMPHIKIFESKTSQDRFALEFSEITLGPIG